METDTIVDFASRGEISDALTDLLRTGAQQLITSAVEAERKRCLGPTFRARSVSASHSVL